jgi:hypothetical protein
VELVGFDALDADRLDATGPPSPPGPRLDAIGSTFTAGPRRSRPPAHLHRRRQGRPHRLDGAQGVELVGLDEDGAEGEAAPITPVGEALADSMATAPPPPPG